jgi:hypothetical protein
MMKHMSLYAFHAALAAGPWAWPGGYPMYFVMADGETLSFKAAEENKAEIESAIEDEDSNAQSHRYKLDPQWLPVGVDINWEDDALFCAHTNEQIPSAYGDDEEECAP